MLNVCFNYGQELLLHINLTNIKTHHKDIQIVRSNGIVVRCPGLFHGEVIIHVDESHKIILIALMSSNPSMSVFSSCFQQLCQKSFIQYILIVN